MQAGCMCMGVLCGLSIAGLQILAKLATAFILMFCRSHLQAIMMVKLQNNIFLMLYSIFTIPLGTCKEA